MVYLFAARENLEGITDIVQIKQSSGEAWVQPTAPGQQQAVDFASRLPELRLVGWCHIHAHWLLATPSVADVRCQWGMQRWQAAPYMMMIYFRRGVAPVDSIVTWTLRAECMEFLSTTHGESAAGEHAESYCRVLPQQQGSHVARVHRLAQPMNANTRSAAAPRPLVACSREEPVRSSLVSGRKVALLTWLRQKASDPSVQNGYLTTPGLLEHAPTPLGAGPWKDALAGFKESV